MPLYLVSFTSGPPMHVHAPDPEAAKAHATKTTTYAIDGQDVSTRGVAVDATKVKD